MHPSVRLAVVAGLALVAADGMAAERLQAILPPAAAWNGASRALAVPAEDPWITPAEASGFARTPRYEETVAWLRRLCDAAPELEMKSLGTSPEGRELWVVVATRAGAFTPEALRATGLPLVFAQAGIHAGEIDGKDAGLMLLRDLTVRGTLRTLLERVNLVFLPIFNVDGHERFSPYTRINQRGPEAAGWRTNSRNLNLNRDYTKQDAVEMQLLVRALREWDPDLYLDLHVTDGFDAQYDVTWGMNGEHGWSPSISKWLSRIWVPAVRDDLRRMGHVPGPFLWPHRETDFAAGMIEPMSEARLSTGYGDLCHLPTILVETHSLKPFEQRVLGTYVLLRRTLQVAGEEAAALRAATAKDRSRRAPEVVLRWKVPDGTPASTVEWLGIERRLSPSPITGGVRSEWTGRPVTLRVPLLHQDEPEIVVARPAAYWIPPAFGDVAARLLQHGIAVERTPASRELEVETYRITSARLDSVPYEGRVRVTPTLTVERVRRSFPAGSIRVPTDQPLGDLAVVLLEPGSPDSYFQWGFFHSALQRTEYVEDYVMEPMAERMLEESPELRTEFQRKLLDEPGFAASPTARLEWFYARTPWYDAEARRYPVARER